MRDYNGKWLSGPEHVLFEVDAGVATITLNRPEKRNALSPELLHELYGAFLEADDRIDVSVIILAGAGKDFCAGYDLAGRTRHARETKKTSLAPILDTEVRVRISMTMSGTLSDNNI